MARQNTWTNSDGLVVGYGTHTVDNQVPAVTGEVGSPVKYMTMVITGTGLEDIGSLTAASLYPQGAIIRRGSRIQRATLVVTEAFSTGSSPTLTIGTVKWDAVGTVDDLDGIDATIAATAIDTVGEVVACDGALVGATSGVTTVGATSNSDVRVVAGYATAAFTTGKAILTIEYVEPALGETVVN